MRENKTYTAVRNMNVKGASGELRGTEEHFIGNQREGDPCYIVAKSLSELFSAIVWKVEFVMNLNI